MSRPVRRRSVPLEDLCALLGHEVTDLPGRRALAALYATTVPEDLPSDEALARGFTNAISSLKTLRAALDNSRYFNGKGELPYLDVVAGELETMRRRTSIEWWSTPQREVIVDRSPGSTRAPSVAAPGRHNAPLTSHGLGPTVLITLVVESIDILAALGLRWAQRHSPVNTLVRSARPRSPMAIGPGRAPHFEGP